MASLLALYGAPKDPAAFDKHYFETHIHIANRIPGLRKNEVSAGAIAALGGPSKYHLVARLDFDDLASIQKALASPEGQAAAADVQAFATGGVEMLIFDTRDLT